MATPHFLLLHRLYKQSLLKVHGAPSTPSTVPPALLVALKQGALESPITPDGRK
jgi:hypothetical protein